MAYMSQERKKRISDDLKKVIPKSWKWSLRVEHHSTLVLTIRQAPVDLLAEFKKAGAQINEGEMHWRLNRYHWAKYPLRSDLKIIFADIFDAMGNGNHDNSDPMTDYFDVGWYIDVQVGEWDNPFLHVPVIKAKAKEMA